MTTHSNTAGAKGYILGDDLARLIEPMTDDQLERFQDELIQRLPVVLEQAAAAARNNISTPGEESGKEQENMTDEFDFDNFEAPNETSDVGIQLMKTYGMAITSDDPEFSEVNTDGDPADYFDTLKKALDKKAMRVGGNLKKSNEELFQNYLSKRGERPSGQQLTPPTPSSNLKRSNSDLYAEWIHKKGKRVAGRKW